MKDRDAVECCEAQVYVSREAAVFAQVWGICASDAMPKRMDESECIEGLLRSLRSITPRAWGPVAVERFEREKATVLGIVNGHRNYGLSLDTTVGCLVRRAENVAAQPVP